MVVNQLVPGLLAKQCQDSGCVQHHTTHDWPRGGAPRSARLQGSDPLECTCVRALAYGELLPEPCRYVPRRLRRRLPSRLAYVTRWIIDTPNKLLSYDIFPNRVYRCLPVKESSISFGRCVERAQGIERDSDGDDGGGFGAEDARAKGDGDGARAHGKGDFARREAAFGADEEAYFGDADGVASVCDGLLKRGAQGTGGGFLPGDQSDGARWQAGQRVHQRTRRGQLRQARATALFQRFGGNLCPAAAFALAGLLSGSHRALAEQRDERRNAKLGAFLHHPLIFRGFQHPLAEDDTHGGIGAARQPLASADRHSLAVHRRDGGGILAARAVQETQRVAGGKAQHIARLVGQVIG